MFKKIILLLSAFIALSYAEPPVQSPNAVRKNNGGAPYPPSGWKPKGAPFTLPKEFLPQQAANVEVTKERVEYAGQSTTVVPSNSYLPPANDYEESSTNDDNDEDDDGPSTTIDPLRVQGFFPFNPTTNNNNNVQQEYFPPQAVGNNQFQGQNNQQQQFGQYRLQLQQFGKYRQQEFLGQQQQFGQVNEQFNANTPQGFGQENQQFPQGNQQFGQENPQFIQGSQQFGQENPQFTQGNQQFGQENQFRNGPRQFNQGPQFSQGPPQFGPRVKPTQEYGPPKANNDNVEQNPSESDNNDSNDQPQAAQLNNASPNYNSVGAVMTLSNGRYYVLTPDNTLQRVIFMTSQDANESRTNGFTAQLRYMPVEPIRDPIYAYNEQGQFVRIFK